MSNEGQIIARIERALTGGSGRIAGGGGAASAHARLVLGIGDDAALVAPGSANLVLTCDSFLEGVHFLPDLHPADSIGYKALVRATSDIAAMGALPHFFLLTLALPDGRTDSWLDGMLGGLGRAARSMKMALIGGDTTKNPRIAITITVVGEIKPGRALTRSGARAGDLIYASGALGRAELGLALVRRGLAGRQWARPLVRHHLYPAARLELGAWLAENRIPSAAMDLSDGLSTDLARLCAASGVGARLRASQIPQPRIPRRLAPRLQSLRVNLSRLALHGGDDYELLFTVPPERVNTLRRAPGAAGLAAIGKITRGPEILLLDSTGRTTPLESLGWDPFRKK